VILSTDQPVPELALPIFDLRSLARRLALPALLAGVAVALALVAGGHVQAFADALVRGLGLNPGWAALAVALEAASIAGYIVLLSLVAGRATPRIATVESAQITLAGAAATRLLPTAGAGGAALALWALRRAGLSPRCATRTLLAFLVVLYSVFLSAIALSGAALALGIVDSRGPAVLGAIPALAALIAIALALGLGSRRSSEPRSRLGRGAQLLGDAVRDALALVRSGDARLAGALAYWLFDAAVVWAMLHAFGSQPSLLVVALAYFIGQVANTLPIPGSVTGGMAGVLIAFGVPAGLALPSVLAYRAVAIWLPSPVGIAAVARLRATVARWASEDAAVPALRTAAGAGS
jgi:uncharacterized membrane protein YbhN (UPF0104 family)